MVKQNHRRQQAVFLEMKELTVTGYFTSEIGATSFRISSTSGRFEGCVPLNLVKSFQLCKKITPFKIQNLHVLLQSFGYLV